MAAGPTTSRSDERGAGELSRPFEVGFALIALCTAGAIAITAGVTSSGVRATTGASGGSAVLQALARSLIVAIPLAVALYACRRPPQARFGKLLLGVSALWFLSSLSTSSSSLLYSIGRVSGWFGETGLVLVLLAFPDGRLRTRTDRVLTGLSLVAAALYIVSAPLIARYPEPSPWSTCYHTCPSNAFMVLAHQPAFVGELLAPIRDSFTAFMFLVVATRLAMRLRAAKPLMRRTLAPVFVTAILQMAVFATALVARRIAPDSTVTQAAVWVAAFGPPMIALGFLAGLARWHLFVTAGVRTVNARLREMPGPEQVQELLAGAFDDPELQIASWSGKQRSWINVDGEPLTAPAPESDRWLTEARDGRTRVVAILHDAALRDDSAFVESAASAASIAFASDRVALRTAGIVRELRASRGRILAAADTERRRIERDLHDGAQQRLVGLCIHLELAAERAGPAEAAELRELIAEVERALEEMRSLTHGIYPAALLEQGLAPAVRSAALRSPVPASVEVEGLGEYPREITTAVYFCCVEALQNVAKHAPHARSVHVVLRDSGSILSFSVSDDGPGMASGNARVGAGMLNMRDRLSTIGGELTVKSPPGEGTRVGGRIPLSALRQDDRYASRPGHAARRHNRATS